MPLQGIAPRTNWLGGVSLIDYKIVWKIKMRENKTTLGDFNCTMDKMESDAENKTQRLHRCCSNYALSNLIIDNGREPRFTKIRYRQGLY